MSTRPLPNAPKYRQIADDLRTRILRNEFAAGQRIPGENDLMREYTVARATARQALATLQAEGLTVARRGSGVFVRPFRPTRRRLPVQGQRPGQVWGSGRTVWEADGGGRAPVVDRVEVREITASELVARMLDLGNDRRVLMRAHRLVQDRKPILHSVVYLPAALVAGSPIVREDFDPERSYGILEQLGHGPVHLIEEMRARMPASPEAALLELPAGTPVIVLCRTAFEASGRPVEFTKLTLDSDAYVLQYDLSRP